MAHHATGLCDALQHLLGIGGGVVGEAHRDHGLGVGSDRLCGDGGLGRVGGAEGGDLGNGGVVSGDRRCWAGRGGGRFWRSVCIRWW